MSKLLFFFFVGFVVFSACARNANRPFTEDEIVRIYVATEYSEEQEAEKIASQYQLTNESRRHTYYKMIRDLTDTPEKYEAFLNKVDAYKRLKMTQSPAHP